MGGLHYHWSGERGLAHLGEHAQPIEIRHHEVEHDRIEAIGAGQERDCGVATSGEDRVVAGARDHALKQAALDGIVINDENTLGHDGNSTQLTQQGTVPNWGDVGG
jgi:hypothetical protein